MSLDGVRVAVRIRPQNARERAAGYKVGTTVLRSQKSIQISDKTFKYDHVFDIAATQEEVFEEAVESLVEVTMNGFNATILAYGQTGSGKTHTMGTAFEASMLSEDKVGVIPRAAIQIFNYISSVKSKAAEAGEPEPQINVEVQFVEIYNEEVADLLSPNGRNANVRIVENPNNDIQLQNATFLTAANLDEAMEILRRGSLNRTTGATNMNEQSSRSHAIFSLHIRQEKMVSVGDDTDDNVLTALTAKLHFVDLAGSERMQRTGATGQRAKEGCKINEGLLMLGNVINALTDPKVSFIPYRSSKLTRVLRDSLGGNSKTLMIACISPNDVDFAETFSTLNYAARANTIKNKVKVNRDHGGAIVAQLRAQIAELESELNEFRQGKRVVNDDGEVAVSDQFHENAMLMAELNKLRPQNVALKQTADVLTERVAQLKSEVERQRIGNVLAEAGADSAALQSTIDDIVKVYVDESARLEARVQELTSENEEYKRRNLKLQRAPESPYVASPYNHSNALLEEARRQLDEEKRKLELRREQRAATAPSSARMESSASSTTIMESSVEMPGTSNSSARSSPDTEDEDVEMAELTTESDAEADQTLADAEISRALVLDDVAEVEDEISLKERLINELERKEREFVRMRSDYDRKLQELHNRMMETEKERDQMVLSVSQKKSSTDKESEQRVKAVRADYERRLNQIKSEYNGMRRVQSQYDAIRKREESSRRDLEKAKRELQIAKETRVRLMTQMREEGKKVKRAEMDVARRMARLEKEARVKDNKIRTLETRDRQREEFMRRKIETSNRAQQIPRSTQRFGGTKLTGRNTRVTPTSAREKWSLLEKKINSCVSEYRNMSKLNNQLVRLINQRTEVERTLNELERKFVATKDPEEREELNAELETTTAHLKYVKSEVAEMERRISEIESSNKENDNDGGGNVQASLMNLISKCDSLSECRHLLHNLVNWALMKANEVDTEKAKSAELAERMEECQQENSVQQLKMSELIKSVKRSNGETGPRAAAGELTFIMDKDSEQTFVLDPTATPKRTAADLPNPALRTIAEKHRRRTATPTDLLIPPEKRSATKGFDTISEESPATSDERAHSTRNSPLDDAFVEEAMAEAESHLVHTFMFEKRPTDLSAEAGRLAVVDRNRMCSIYDLETQKCSFAITMGRSGRSVHLFHAQPHLVGIVQYFNIHVWDIRVAPGKQVYCLHSSGVVDQCYGTERSVHSSESEILPYAVSPDGHHMVTKHVGCVRVWDLSNFRSMGRIYALNGESAPITSLAVGNGGDRVCAGLADGNITMVQLDSNERETTTDFIPRHDSAVNGMFSTDSSIYTISNTKLMRHSLIDQNRDLSESASQNTPLSVITPFRAAANVEPNGDDMFAVGEGATIKLCSASRQSQRATTHLELRDTHRNRVVAMTSSDGLIASCGIDNTVKIWSPAL